MPLVIVAALFALLLPAAYAGECPRCGRNVKDGAEDVWHKTGGGQSAVWCCPDHGPQVDGVCPQPCGHGGSAVDVEGTPSGPPPDRAPRQPSEPPPNWAIVPTTPKASASPPQSAGAVASSSGGGQGQSSGSNGAPEVDVGGFQASANAIGDEGLQFVLDTMKHCRDLMKKAERWVLEQQEPRRPSRPSTTVEVEVNLVETRFGILMSWGRSWGIGVDMGLGQGTVW
jgi:hypothetical protein